MALKIGTWSPEEDRKLKAYIKRYGIWNWSKMPEAAGLLRSGKSCRLRWMNYLNPDIKRGNFTREEEETILRMHEELGNKWSAMAAALPGRTDNEIKNHWNYRLKKHKSKPRAQSQGSITTVEASANQNKVTEFHQSFTNNALEALKSESHGSLNIFDMESTSQLPSSLCSQNVDENFETESPGEDVFQSLQYHPLWVENSHVEDLQEIFSSVQLC